MTRETSDDGSERFEPRAAGAMARMFDGVTARYDLLNALMTVGQDGAWRAALARAVPGRAAVVLDLCTGNGASLAGLARPGRLVLGMDVSLGMLERAAAALPESGWAPRLACADAFRLPLRDGALDAVTIAFGMRNLRPRAAALAELRRVLRPDGALAVLEATAPRPGAAGALHAFHLRRIVPLLGRLSDDPSAYRYLSESIFEFGSGASFEADLARAGFEVVERRRFLLGATTLWSARRAAMAPVPAPGQPPAGSGEIPTARAATLQNARPARADGGNSAHPGPGWEREWRAWTSLQALIAAALSGALVWGTVQFAKYSPALPLGPWQRRGLWLLLIGGGIGFLVRTLALAARLAGPPRRR